MSSASKKSSKSFTTVVASQCFYPSACLFLHQQFEDFKLTGNFTIVFNGVAEDAARKTFNEAHIVLGATERPNFKRSVCIRSNKPAERVSNSCGKGATNILLSIHVRHCTISPPLLIFIPITSFFLAIFLSNWQFTWPNRLCHDYLWQLAVSDAE